MTKILIAGAGIGGLSAALALHDAGFEVRVFERARALTEIGAGIQISPNGIKILDRLGLLPALEAVAFRPEAIEFRLYRSGLRVLRMTLGDDIVRRYGAPYFHLHRADLLSVLQEAARARGISIETGRAVSGYEQDADRATLLFADGSCEEGDALVGCDGIHSAIREKMLGPEQPQFTGHVAWRGVIPTERLRHAGVRPVLTSWMAPRSHAVTYFLRRGELINFVGVRENQIWRGESWTEPGDKDDLRKAFADWHPTLRAIVEEIDEPYRWALFSRRSLRKWSEGRVTLLGDACHPMLPYVAQGAVMAIEDAYILSRCLKGADDIPTALKHYEDMRLKRTARVQGAARANGKTFHLSSPLRQFMTYGKMALGSTFAPGVVARRNDWIFSYDATKIM